MNLSTLLRVAALFASLSLVSFGGGNAIIPQMHHDAVTVEGWMDDRTFADIFAISEAAPGPSSLIVTLIGLKAAGIPGALVAVIAMLVPSSILVFLATRGWERFRDSPWRIAAERGLAPISLGLIAASGVTIARASDHGPAAYAVTAVATVLLVWTKVNPLMVMAAAALLGILGIV
jgi:chromate transporter